MKDRKTNIDGIKRTQISNREYLSFMQLAGIRNIEDIELSNLETNDQVS